MVPVSKKNTYPVFYDPQSRRWGRFKRLTQVIAVVLSIICIAFFSTMLIDPGLPSLGLSSNGTILKVHHLWKETSKALTVKPQKQSKGFKANTQSPVASSVEATPKSEIIGFYVNWDDNSFTSLKHNISRIDKLMPEWLHLSTADGAIAVDDPVKQERTLTYIRQNRPKLPIMALINNYDSQTQSWNGEKLAQVLANPVARTRLIQQLQDFIRSNNLNGVNIDFENLPVASQSNLIVFMSELSKQFHPQGWEVSQSVPVDDPAYNYRALADLNDYLILMAYDEHYPSSKAGAIASQKWYAEKLRLRLAEVPANKYMIAIGNYGYDWQGTQTDGTEVSFQETLKVAEESGGQIHLDSTTLNPTFNYYDDQDKLHQVWFLDAITAFNEIVEAQTHGVRGFSLWRMGSEDPSIWSVLEQRTQLNSTVAEKLSTIQYGYDIDYRGQGEVLKVTATPKEGKREIKYDKQSGLISDHHLVSYPSPYVITRWGGENKKKIVLTFDDGPDPRYTADVLDVLKKYQAKATFFVVGMNASANPDLLRRIVNEGHEIGSHTFTHPNIANTSPKQLRLEMNATERVFESELGIRSVLFRPPYAEDVEPSTPDQVAPLQFTGDLGYYTIGMHIDPGDWRNPDAAEIVKETIAQAVSGAGNIVLLHDSGGDRSHTVAALPKIIESLRERGFEIVPISNLLGLSRNALMPVIPDSEKMISEVSGTGFFLLNGFNSTLYYLFLIGIELSVMRLIFVGVLAIYEWHIRHRRLYDSAYSPSVSVLVPAFNEEKVICKTIDSLLRCRYPNFNIVVVDDGSTDDTYKRLLSNFGKHPQVKIFTKTNGGKAQALNYAIQLSDAEIVVTLDADTILRPNAIGKLTRHFINPQIGAIAGNAKVGNRLNILTYWQALEYITSQNLERRAFGLLNCISVVPGAIGAWRRQLILKAGGFAHDTLAEDADLTLTLLQMGYKVDYDEEAIALTEAPDTVDGFLKQRFRWMFGTLQAVWKHRETLFRPRYGAIGMFAIPNVVLFQICFPLISPLMDLVMLQSICWTVWHKYQQPGEYTTQALSQVLPYYLLFLSVDFLAAFIAFCLERKEDWKLLLWLIPQRFLYRQLMYYVAIKSVIKAIQGHVVGWGKLERKATVQ